MENSKACCSLPLEVDTDEKQDQKATINNSIWSKQSQQGHLLGGRMLDADSPFTAHSIPPLGSCKFQSLCYIYLVRPAHLSYSPGSVELLKLEGFLNETSKVEWRHNFKKLFNSPCWGSMLRWACFKCSTVGAFVVFTARIKTYSEHQQQTTAEPV